MSRNWCDRTIEMDCAKCRLRRHATLTPEPVPGLELIRKSRVGSCVARPGARICIEGEPSTGIFTLVSGWAFRYKRLHDGRRQILDFRLPGDFFGLGHGGSQAQDHSVECITPVVLCVFDKPQFEGAMQSDPALAALVRRILRAEEGAMFEHLVDIGRRSATEAVGHMLLELCLRQRQGRVSRGCSCQFPITQLHLADALGLTATHVNRVLRKLREDGLASVGDQRLVIHNVARLSDLCEFNDRYTTRMPVI